MWPAGLDHILTKFRGWVREAAVRVAADRGSIGGSIRANARSMATAGASAWSRLTLHLATHYC